jgi:8-amino-7-oxononanoate synthase
MSRLDAVLLRRLGGLKEQGLLRSLRTFESPQSARIRCDDREFLNFGSNDYLGLANHPALREAAAEAARRFGAGSGASRLICGSLAPHRQLEEALAAFKGVEAALVYSSGYAAALGTICAMVGPEDIIILDKLVHACIVDAARLSGAKMRVFAHNDLDDLEAILKWARAKLEGTGGEALVVTESVFSMEGDQAPLKEIVQLKERYHAWLMLDEAHATGLFGPNQRGLSEETGVNEQVEVHMGTLGKALGASGGYICGSRALVDWLVNRARSFIFSTAPVPAAAAAATAGIQLVQSREGAVRNRVLRERMKPLGEVFRSAIFPVIVGAEARAVEVANVLREQGIFLPAVRYPTVPRGKARLRLSMTASHTEDDVMQVVAALKALNLIPTPQSH